jgi:hypothetical protein
MQLFVFWDRNGFCPPFRYPLLAFGKSEILRCFWQLYYVSERVTECILLAGVYTFPLKQLP